MEGRLWVVFSTCEIWSYVRVHSKQNEAGDTKWMSSAELNTHLLVWRNAQTIWSHRSLLLCGEKAEKKTNFELVLKYLRSESFHDAKQVIWWHSVWTTREINSFPFMGSSVRFQDKDHEYNKDGDRATKNIIAIFF